MKKFWLSYLTLLLLSSLFSCSGSPDAGETAADVPSVTVFADNKMEYAVVIAARSSDTVFNFADVFADLSGTKPVQRNDRLAETPLEVLVGTTGRALSVSLLEELTALASEDAFHYIIAEKDGKIAVLSDNDIGYQYLRDRLSDVYTKNGTMKIPVDCHDLQTVTWEEYYKSDYYAAVLKKEEERAQREKEKEVEALKRKQEELERYRKLAVSFPSDDFGKRQEFPKDRYSDPLVYPEKSHPRVLFTANSIEKIRANLTAEENKAAYNRYISLSEQFITGIFPKLADRTTHNMDYNIMASIEAKAFRYAMTGEELYGYQAIYAIKNALLTLDIPDGTLGDDCRAFGYVMYIAGCVYDWCYDLLTEDCKKQIINGCVTLMGTEMEMGVPPVKQGAAYGHGTEAQLLRD